MSPTPPVLGAATDCNGAPPQYNPGFNHNDGESKGEAVVSSMMTNGVPEELKTEEVREKAKRGRPAKAGGKQQLPNGTVKKRGRPPKVKAEDIPTKQSKITDTMKKTKRTVNRFKDVTKEELLEKFLPDRIKPDLDILIIGINPGLFAAYKGHHYAGPGNHFWSCLNMSGFVDRKMTAENDVDLLDYGIGFSTIVRRTTPAAKDLSSKEIREGAKKLVEKIQLYKPKIAVFNGKGIYELFSKEIFGQKKKDFAFGTQANRIPETDTYVYVMPSSSARCAQFPRAQDKVQFYIKLKQLRDSLTGIQPDNQICEVGYTFDLKKATELAKVQNIKQEKYDPEYDAFDGTKNNPAVTSSFPPFSSTELVAASSGQIYSSSVGATTNLIKSLPNGLHPVDKNNNILVGVKPDPLLPPSGGMVTQMTNNNNNVRLTTDSTQCNGHEDNNVTARHTHLVHYLRKDADGAEPGPSHGRKVGTPLMLSPANPKLQQDVSEEQRQERVGNWVREQQSLEYDSEPPMGIEGPEEGAAQGLDGSSAAGVEIDRASQLSTLSAGVSGSMSESTSGYGSIDASSRRVRLDRVEMWLLEQQHVRRHNPANQQLQQSIQAAAASSHAQSTAAPATTTRMETQQTTASYYQPALNWVQPCSVTVGYPMALIGGIYTQNTVGGSTNMVVGQAHANSGRTVKLSGPPNHSVDPGAGPSSVLTPAMSGGRSSPYFARTGTPSRREGGSGSSFGTSVRPPVPLYSSWGGEESGSGGSGLSSPVVPFVSNPTTQPSPVQSYNSNTNNNNATDPSNIPQNISNALSTTWQPVLSPYFNM